MCVRVCGGVPHRAAASLQNALLAEGGSMAAAGGTVTTSLAAYLNYSSSNFDSSFRIRFLLMYFRGGSKVAISGWPKNLYADKYSSSILAGVKPLQTTLPGSFGRVYTVWT